MLGVLNFIEDQVSGIADDGKKRRETAVQFDEALFDWITAELLNIFMESQTGLKVSDIFDEVVRTRQTAMGQAAMKKNLLKLCQAYKDADYRSAAEQKVLKFVPLLFLKAVELREQKESNRRHKVKSKWMKAGIATSMGVNMKSKRQWSDSAPLVSSRTANVSSHGAARSGLFRPNMPRSLAVVACEEAYETPPGSAASSRVTAAVERARRGRANENEGLVLPPLYEAGRGYSHLAAASHLALQDSMAGIEEEDGGEDARVLPLLMTRCGVQRQVETSKRAQLPPVTTRRNQQLNPRTTSENEEDSRHNAVILLNREARRRQGSPLPQTQTIMDESPPQAAFYPGMSLGEMDQVLDLRAKKNRPKGKKKDLKIMAEENDLENKEEAASSTRSLVPTAKATLATSVMKTSRAEEKRQITAEIPEEPPVARTRARPAGRKTVAALKALMPSDRERQTSSKFKEMKKINEKVSGMFVEGVFKEYDKDNSNHLEIKELLSFLKNVSAEIYGQELPVSQEDADFVLAVCDVSATNSIKKEELFIALKVWDCYMQQADDIDHLFNRYDTNRSGQLEKDQLKSLLYDLSETYEFDPPTEHEIDYVFLKADVTKTGSIVRLELANAVAAYTVEKHRQQMGPRLHPSTHHWIETSVANLLTGLVDFEQEKEIVDDIISVNSQRPFWMKKVENILKKWIIKGFRESEDSRIQKEGEKERREADAQKFCINLVHKQVAADPESYGLDEKPSYERESITIGTGSSWRKSK